MWLSPIVAGSFTDCFTGLKTRDTVVERVEEAMKAALGLHVGNEQVAGRRNQFESSQLQMHGRNRYSCNLPGL